MTIKLYSLHKKPTKHRRPVAYLVLYVTRLAAHTVFLTLNGFFYWNFRRTNMGRKISNLRVFKSLNRREINVVNMNFWMKRFYWKICLFLRHMKKRDKKTDFVKLQMWTLHNTSMYNKRRQEREDHYFKLHTAMTFNKSLKYNREPTELDFVSDNQLSATTAETERMFWKSFFYRITAYKYHTICSGEMLLLHVHGEYRRQSETPPPHFHEKWQFILCAQITSSWIFRTHRTRNAEHDRSAHTSFSLSRCLVLKPSLIPGQRRWRPHRWLSFP